MSTTTNASQSAQPRPGQRAGVQTEFTIIANVKPGGAEVLRERGVRAMTDPERRAASTKGAQQIGTVHNFRVALFDNDTRHLFASVFDGDWDAYIDDFGSDPFFAEALDNTWEGTEGYPGIHSPAVKNWLVAHQVPALTFTSTYPDLTARQILKDQRVNEAFQAVLDTPEFQAALKNPANAELVATPAFQKLLGEAAI
jgi:hypothetical protein